VATHDDESLDTDTSTPPADLPDTAGAETSVVDELTSARDEYLALAQRTQADFDNFRKRAGREHEQAEARGAAKLAKELLSSVDDLTRAADTDASEETLRQGILAVRDGLQTGLQRAGIACYGQAGDVFDPRIHEAVATAPVQDSVGKVVEVLQLGYLLDERVLRPARVVVGE
jgi:molecular chaperone GrpE